MVCAAGNLGFRRWYGSRDADGFREYHVIWGVRIDDTPGTPEGPAVALATPGLFLPGASWVMGADVDLDAVCLWTAEMRPQVDERTQWWEVEQVFSSRPNSKCINRSGTGTGTGNPANDPLSEPPIISGNFVKYTEEKTRDRNGNNITNSAHERIRGPLVEFDASRLTVRITQNEATLDLLSKLTLIDQVNSVAMWDFVERTVKLSNINWEKKYSANCTCYFQITYEFEVSPEGFDRVVMDEGTKALNGEWNKTTGVWDLKNIGGGAPDKTNPTHFIRITDFYGNPMRCVLDGNGKPATSLSGTSSTVAGSITIEYYQETDLLAELSLPHDLEC